jgi:hypothetical protein
MRIAWRIVPLVLVISGCAVRRPSAWRLSGGVLAPPMVSSVAATQAAFTAPGDSVAQSCASTDAVHIEWRKGRVTVAVDRAVMEKQRRGWLADWSARCGDAALGERVLDSLPLTSLARIQLMRDSDVREGLIDLAPANRLQVIGASAVGRMPEIVNIAGNDSHLEVDLKGPDPSAAGREVAWYGFEPRQGGGSRMVALSEDPHHYYSFGPDAAYYRFFYMADRKAAVAGAPSFDKLPRTLAGCGAPVQCIAVPPNVGVNVLTRVMVNGKAVVVGNATVRNVIQASRKRPEDVLPTLTIAKPFRGKLTAVKFDRTQPDILNLYLDGSEEIRW